MPVFELHFEHCIGQRLGNCAILFNECLFRHTFWVRKDMGMAGKYENQWWNFEILPKTWLEAVFGNRVLGITRGF